MHFCSLRREDADISQDMLFSHIIFNCFFENYTSCTPITQFSKSLSICPPPFVVPPQRKFIKKLKIKVNKNTNKNIFFKRKTKKRNTYSSVFPTSSLGLLTSGAIVCHTEYMKMLIVQYVLGQVQGLWPLAPSILDPHQKSSLISCCCPKSWRSYYGPHEQALHMLR